jgi:murein L,D-transpeptidase YcbB/YkuD
MRAFTNSRPPRTAVLLVTGLAVAALAVPVRGMTQSPCESGGDPALAELLRNRLEAGRAQGAVTAAGEVVRAAVALPAFYLRREDTPAWIVGSRPSSCAQRLLASLRAAGDDGLDGADYHLATLEALFRGTPRSGAGSLVDLDLLLTDAYLTFGSHLLQGRVNPATLQPEWLANRRSVDMAAHLQDALASGDIDAALEALRPRQQGYRVLRRLLARLRRIDASGGWGTVARGPTLHVGDRDIRVPLLRRRLVLGGDLPAVDTAAVTDAELYDAGLAEAVRRFQSRHGLAADGNAGRETLAALNVPVEQRIRQVVVNMERWRWLPDDLGRRHIRVNIADFHVEVWQEDTVVLEMKAVVGKGYRETPMFSATMTYMVLAPYWHVPPRIAAVDKLPLLRKDPGYLAQQRMTLLSAATNEPVDPSTVDFATMTGAAFNRLYRIRQDPGPLNALGEVKFMLPNPYDVYLHDTPSRDLFAKTSRAFSSGCIRIEKPLALAEYLLAGDPAWSPERIRSVIAKGRETTIWLKDPVPVHILYWTAFVDDDGVVQFRPDIYGRDQAVQRALDAAPPRN